MGVETESFEAWMEFSGGVAAQDEETPDIFARLSEHPLIGPELAKCGRFLADPQYAGLSDRP